MPILGTPDQGGQHDSRRFNGPRGNPFCFSNYWTDLCSGFNRTPLSGVIEEANYKLKRNRNDCRAAVYVPVSHKELQGLKNRQYPDWLQVDSRSNDGGG